MVNSSQVFADRDSDGVLFQFTEFLCQLTEYYKNRKKPLPSNDELIQLFRIALRNYQDALLEYQK